MPHTEIDPYPVAQLFDRYRKSRDVIYKRLDALNITPHRLDKGNQSYITLEDLHRMDALHRHIMNGGKMAEFTESDNIMQSGGQSDIVRPQLGIDDFLELAQAIALSLRPVDRFSNYEELERCAKNNWRLHSRQVKELIGKMPRGNTYEWSGGFVFRRVYLGERSQSYWSVEKV